jgi:hypothetical protein
MTALALIVRGLDRRTLMRGLAGGSAWGVTVAAALLALSFHQCGTICLGQIVDTTLLSVILGICAIGPLAVLRHKAQAFAR